MTNTLDAAASPTAHSDVLETLVFATAAQQAQALADGKLTAVALLEQVLARIERLNPHLNVVIAQDTAAARAAAQTADAALARGERKPLLGVPVTLKENYDIAGYITSVGDPEWAGNRAEHDAPSVAALREAGAVIVGKTNVPLALADLQSFNAVYGVSNNPWDLTRTTGGSSGGSAAALAAGFSAIDLGSDIGGSIRVPAHFNGVFGHKPSFGLVFNGGLGVPPGKQTLRDLSVAGPLARSADDLRLALQLLLNRDPVASKTWQATLPQPRHAQLRDHRVLVVTQWPGEDASLSEQLVRTRLDALVQQAGLQRVEIADLPAGLWPDLQQTHRLYRSLLAAAMPPLGVEAVQTPTEASALQSGSDDDGADAPWQRGPHLSHAEWLSKHEARLQLRRRWQHIFEHVDLVLTPTLRTNAFPHNHSLPKDARTHPVRYADGERQVRLLDLFNWPGLPVLPGLPATAFPLGLDDAGLPFGAQAVGPFLEDLTPIYFAHLLQEAGLSRFQPPPLALRG